MTFVGRWLLYTDQLTIKINISVTRSWPLKVGGCFIEMATSASLAVYSYGS